MPLLVAAVRAQNNKTYFAMNAEAGRDGVDTFLVTHASEKNIRRFVDQEVDLRFMMNLPRARHYFTKSTGEVGGVMELRRYKDAVDEYLPDSGLFLEDYDGPLRKGTIGASAPRRIGRC